MEVSNQMKEEIRKTQFDLKNAIREHQVWVARRHEDENNTHYQIKVKEAEALIIEIGQTQKRALGRLRSELELYHQRLRSRNKQIDLENDNRYIAQQIRDYCLQYRNKNRQISLLKPSVVTEIHDKKDDKNGEVKGSSDISDNEYDGKSKKQKSSSGSDNDIKDCHNNYSQIHENRSQLNNLNQVKNSLLEVKAEQDKWPQQKCSSSGSSRSEEATPTPSPPPLPQPGEEINQETFLRFLGLVTHHQKELLEKKRRERRKRTTTSTNRNEYVYGNFEAKQKKYSQFPYMQNHGGPPQTRSAKLKKQQKQCDKSSREGSPSGSSSENKIWVNNKPPWASALPSSLIVERIFSPSKRVCHGCGRSDVPSLLVWCGQCRVHQHTGCSDSGRCANCKAALPDPSQSVSLPHPSVQYRDKLAECKQLQDKNIQLCLELQKLQARAAALGQCLDERNIDYKHLLVKQMNTHEVLQKLLNFVNQYKKTAIREFAKANHQCNNK